MSAAPQTVKRKKFVWAPYLLILPSLIYLVLFFAWPMARGLALAVWDDEASLSLNAEASQDSALVGLLPQGASVTISDRQGNFVPPEDLAQQNLLTDTWFKISGVGPDGQGVAGWVAESRIRIRETAVDGTPILGTVRSKLGAESDPLTAVYADANEDSPIIGQLEARAEVDISEQVVLEVWYRVAGETANGEMIEGWAQSRYIQVFGEGGNGRVDRGNTGELTSKYLSRMVNDRFFWPAVRTTLLLIVIIIPIQFVLAIIMALVIQANLKLSSLFLYIFAIPLAASDLAIGIVWFSIFTTNGYLNTILQGLGIIDAPVTYLSAETRYWIIIAIVLAEVWRATSIVMVIVVSGLQAISTEVLEAAELFGAGLWQRLRYIILPLLRPSLQVALILRTILALQVFAVVVALSGGDVVTVLANETYRQYYDFRNLNVAASYAGLILLISMVSAVFYLRTIRTQEEAVG